MKSQFRKLLLVTAVCGIALSSCKKDAPIEQPTLENEPLARVVAWLDAQKKKFKDSTVQNVIASIKENMVGKDLTTEAINAKQKLIIIPLRSAFKTTNDINQPTLKYIVVTEEENHEFQQANIVELIPRDQSYFKTSPNLISGIWNYKNANFDGVFSIMSLTARFMQEREYKNGKLFSTKHLSTKPDKKQSGKESTTERTTGCIDWFLVTTYYYYDGTSSQTWDYLYTTCGEECQNTRTFGGRSTFRTTCGGGGGGSGQESSTSTLMQEDEADEVDSYLPLVRYTYHCFVYRVEGVVTNVLISNITADPIISFGTNASGRITTRVLTLFNHWNIWTNLGTSALIEWNCDILGRYTYSDGTPTYTRQWHKTKLGVG